MHPPSPPRSPGAPRSSLWRAGSVVGGRYRLRAPIGAGAMGEVWRADHVSLGTPVAVKLVDTKDREDAAETLARFQQEAVAAAQLRSPHVVQILDHGADGRVAFIAMEFLEGESLEQRLARRGRLQPSEVADVLREMARGVDRAHAAGIIHRDLKPPNVFIARVDGVEVVKVLDFGIAKVLGTPKDVHLQTQQGFVVGTPAYMSPEQVLGRPVDHRSDLWAMAILTFECITGKRPFEGAALGQLFMAICSSPMPLPSSRAPVPPGFDAWFARAASRDPAQRYPSAREMAEALDAVLTSGGAGESALATGSSRPEGQLPVATGRSEAWSTARVEPARRATPGALLAGLLLAPLSVALVGGALWLVQRPRAEVVTLGETTGASARPAAPNGPAGEPTGTPGSAPPAAIGSSTPSVAEKAPPPSPSASASSGAGKAVPRGAVPRSAGRTGSAKPPVDLGI